MKKTILIPALLGLMTSAAIGAEITVLRCDFQYTHSNQAPFWKTATASFVQPNKMALPVLLDSKPENLGGANPSWDSMVFCSTQSVALQPNGSIRVNVMTKRTMEVIDRPCSQLDVDSVVSTQQESFGIGGETDLDYRFYLPNRTSEQRRRVTYFGNSSEFGNFDRTTAQPKCDDIAGSMSGF